MASRLPILFFSLQFFSYVFVIRGEPELYRGVFPKDFIWGCASSAYQIEGAWNVDGKGVNIWDTFSHTPNKVYGNHTGDIACKSYYKYKEDVRILKSLGVTYYRFSLSWARILPNGTADNVNAKGVEYYNNLINELLKNEIQPMVTLYHWDLPQALEDIGGWLNHNISDVFSDYARVCFENFGDRVKFWATLNEPWVSAVIGYANGVHAPGITRPKDGPYLAGHTLLLAHGKAWHVYDKEFRNKQKGKISIVLNSDWHFPQKNEDSYLKAAERGMAWTLGWFANPIYGSGDYPEVMKTLITRNSKAEGIPNRLPQFTDSEKKMLKGTADFFGLNHYTSTMCGNIPTANISAVDWNYWSDREIYTYRNGTWPQGAPLWLNKVPQGLRKLLSYIKKEYGDPEIYITENGWSEKGEDARVGEAALNDTQRVGYITEYINEALKATRLDGVKLKGYFAWSLMDNFEWAEGYHERFGIYRVNFSDPERKRVPKQSAKVYSEIVAENGFPPDSGASTTLPTNSSASTTLPTKGPTDHAGKMEYTLAALLTAILLQMISFVHV